MNKTIDIYRGGISKQDIIENKEYIDKLYTRFVETIYLEGLDIDIDLNTNSKNFEIFKEYIMKYSIA